MFEVKSMKENDLMLSITKKRQEMVKVATLMGMKDTETVRQSRELDMLIILYQKHFHRH
ncbi:aspartyl-phosphate phosphatase Spo0E family protein [Camelliibacillus cellulosilyticus]|uniref:Aspartyl-phosphate phosphatase Spo0E family protein n=1 Tax=Camelliibacillus cellulosilyticus TaxID=2174486 RepID=A0ABV9GQA1_9BACL